MERVRLTNVGGAIMTSDRRSAHPLDVPDFGSPKPMDPVSEGTIQRSEVSAMLASAGEEDEPYRILSVGSVSVGSKLKSDGDKYLAGHPATRPVWVLQVKSRPHCNRTRQAEESSETPDRRLSCLTSIPLQQ